MTAPADTRARPTDRAPKGVHRDPEPAVAAERVAGVAGLTAYIERAIAVERLTLATFTVEHLELCLCERGDAERTAQDERRHPALLVADAYVAEARATYELVVLSARG